MGQIRVLLTAIAFFVTTGFICIPLHTGDETKAAVQEGDGIPPFLCCESNWVDSVMATLSPDERIAQLIMVAAYSNRGAAHAEEITELVDRYGIGGLLFFQGGPVRQAQLTNRYQSKAKVPLLIAMDAEWGLAMRLDSTVRFPRQLTLGAIRNDTAVYDMGREIARQLRRLGVHVSFSPVADVNSNPANPVIGSRSFGEDRKNVAGKAIAYMRGLQDGGVLACAKHFPGHGDTGKDSHHTLPAVNHSRRRLDSLELYPFREMIAAGVGAVMVAHLHVPALDNDKDAPATLSKKIVAGLLKKKMGFEGLVFTDALNMKGVSAYHKPGELDALALLAGNDVLLFSEDVPAAIAAIRKAVKAGKTDQEEIDAHCRKVLMAKQWAGLDTARPVQINGLTADLNHPQADRVNMRLAEEAVTLVRNDNDLLPFKRPDTLRIASVAVGAAAVTPFQQTLDYYAPVTHFTTVANPSDADIRRLEKKLAGYNVVVVSIHRTTSSPAQNFGITGQVVKLTAAVQRKATVVLNIFGNPYVLGRLPDLGRADALIVSYEDMPWLQRMSAQIIFGGIAAKGRLPVSGSGLFPAGTGEGSGSQIRLKYTLFHEMGPADTALDRIDTIVMRAISAGAMPGCQVLAAKDGAVFYHKAFGRHTYDGKQAVRISDLYDLASITKIAATTAALMKLAGEGKISLGDSLGKHLSLQDTTGKGGIILRDLLAHRAGLAAWIPFWQETMEGGSYRPGIYRGVQTKKYPHRVAKGLYIHRDWPDTVLKRINDSPLSPEKTYLYSDLGYYYLKMIVEKLVQIPLDEYLDSVFYRPMGLTSMMFMPYRRVPDDYAVPTEQDNLFRMQLIRGDVHDPGAAMTGGVGGHAGLFSNANDLAAFMQMYLWGGEYGGERYIAEETLKEFTRCQYCADGIRRGAGFDKPEPDSSKTSPACRCASAGSFGHSGFTGTFAWADPANGVLVVFLSNRVHPDANNKKLIETGVRTRVQEAIYSALGL